MLAVKFHQLGFEVLAHAGKDGLHCLKVLFPEHIAPISGDEYQVHMQGKDTVPSVPQIVICLAWSPHACS